MKQLEPQTLEQQILEVFMKFARVMKSQMSVDTRLMHLTHAQMETLVFLKKHENAQMLDIAEYFHVTKPTATSMLNKLVEMRLVERKQSKDDRRVIHVVLSKSGETLIKNAWKQRAKVAQKLLGLTSVENKEKLLKIMSEMLEQAESIYEK